jgi:hypothetical protein
MALPKYLLQDGHLQFKKENTKTEMITAKAATRIVFGANPKMPVGLLSTDRRPINARIIGPTAII